MATSTCDINFNRLTSTFTAVIISSRNSSATTTSFRAIIYTTPASRSTALQLYFPASPRPTVLKRFYPCTTLTTHVHCHIQHNFFVPFRLRIVNSSRIFQNSKQVASMPVVCRLEIEDLNETCPLHTPHWAT